MKNIIILPYYSYEEADRYIRILDFYKSYCVPFTDSEFLCANRSFIEPHDGLIKKAQELAPVKIFSSLSEVNAYPRGPTIFFWEIMEHIRLNSEKDRGFVLWHESDMIGIRKDWFKKLSVLWNNIPGGVLVMGHYEPPCYCWSDNTYIPRHINGGACYSKELSGVVPDSVRKGYFDIEMFSALKKQEYVKSKCFEYSAVKNIPALYKKKYIAVLHGIAQSKDTFIENVISYVEHGRLRSGQAVEHCCQFYVNAKGVRFCPVHVSGNLEKLINRFLAFSVYIITGARKKMRDQ